MTVEVVGNGIGRISFPAIASHRRSWLVSSRPMLWVRLTLSFEILPEHEVVRSGAVDLKGVRIESLAADVHFDASAKLPNRTESGAAFARCDNLKGRNFVMDCDRLARNQMIGNKHGIFLPARHEGLFSLGSILSINR